MSKTFYILIRRYFRLPLVLRKIIICFILSIIAAVAGWFIGVMLAA
jgi:hypothetical protein